jgi:hypothetical protein
MDDRQESNSKILIEDLPAEEDRDKAFGRFGRRVSCKIIVLGPKVRWPVKES